MREEGEKSRSVRKYYLHWGAKGYSYAVTFDIVDLDLEHEVIEWAVLVGLVFWIQWDLPERLEAKVTGSDSISWEPVWTRVWWRHPQATHLGHLDSLSSPAPLSVINLRRFRLALRQGEVEREMGEGGQWSGEEADSAWDLASKISWY